MTVRILVGDCIRVMDLLLDDESVDCVVTSPPYFGLRDYGVDGQIGLEANMREHIAVLVEVFRQVRRVLRKDGTLWLNYGDAYAGSWGAQSHRESSTNASTISRNQIANHPKRASHTGTIRDGGLKPKDRMLLPARVAIALQDDGWWVRDEIVWHKPNPMPCSVTDRTTPAHEMIYLLSKSARYHYDAEAIKEPIAEVSRRRMLQPNIANQRGGAKQDAYDAEGLNERTGSRRPNEILKSLAARLGKGNARTFRGSGAYTQGQSFNNSTGVERGSHGNAPNDSGMRNRRSVWTVAPQPFKQAHFATFPPKLIEPCILAGCPVGGTVLDPFGGAGTTGLVAQQHSRNAILIELNPAYAEIARNRIAA